MINTKPDAIKYLMTKPKGQVLIEVFHAITNTPFEQAVFASQILVLLENVPQELLWVVVNSWV